MKRARWIAIAAAACLAPPSSALAADTTTSVTGTVDPELTLAAGTPTVMALKHSVIPTTTSVVDVTSTSTNWTLSISDKTATTPGYMDKVTCGTATITGGSLTNPLQWSADGAIFNNLSSTPATVGTGSLVGAKTVTFKQALESSDAVAAGDCYQLTVTYTVTDS